MHSSPCVSLALAFATAVSVVSSAQALTVIPPSFEKLVAEADIVVDGTVTGVRSQIEESGGRPLVYTYVTIEVADTMKGSPPPSVELRMLGGTVGDLTVHISGMPRFEAGDRQIFFVVGNGVQFCPLVGIGHGLYPILNRATDGAEVVLRHNLESIRDVSQVDDPLDHEAAAARGRSAVDLTDTMTVADFKRQIREEVAHARAQ